MEVLYPKFKAGSGLLSVGWPSTKWFEHTLELGLGCHSFPSEFFLFKAFIHLCLLSSFFRTVGKGNREKGADQSFE